MFLSQYFTFDGKQSEEFGIQLVHMEDGMIETNFGMGGVNIIEEKPKDVKIPYYYRRETTPLTFTITLAKEKEWTYADKIKIAEWLFQNQYKPFISSTHPNIVYYGMFIGDSKRFFNEIDQGYITLQMRCNAPFGFSNPQEVLYKDFTKISTPATIEINNLSNINENYKPDIIIEMKTGGNVSFKNLTNGNKETKILNLLANENIYINNEKEKIESSIIGTYRYDDFNDNWLELVKGVNIIEVSNGSNGSINGYVTIKSRYPIVL